MIGSQKSMALRERNRRSEPFQAGFCGNFKGWSWPSRGDPSWIAAGSHNPSNRSLCLALLWTPLWLLLLVLAGMHTGLLKERNKLSTGHTLSQFFLGWTGYSISFWEGSGKYLNGTREWAQPPNSPSQLGSIVTCWGQCLGQSLSDLPCWEA